LATAFDVTSNATFFMNINREETLSSSSSSFYAHIPDNSAYVYFGIRNNSSPYEAYIQQYDISEALYTSDVTWANGSTNSERATLQQALSVGSNVMDAEQMGAITDANIFTLGNTFDLAIGLKSVNDSSPSSTGVEINYDATSLNQGAILGTDYNYDFPDSTTVRVTSSAAQNLKVKVM